MHAIKTVGLTQHRMGCNGLLLGVLVAQTLQYELTLTITLTHQSVRTVCLKKLTCAWDGVARIILMFAEGGLVRESPNSNPLAQLGGWGLEERLDPVQSAFEAAVHQQCL